MQDQNISPNPESQPDAQPISDAPAPAAPSPSKKKTGLFIVGSFGVLIAVILISCIATNAIDIRKIIPGFGHYDKPQLSKDHVLIGYDGKYFLTGAKFGDTAKNIAKVFDLYEFDTSKLDFSKKVENVDALLRRNPDATKSIYGAETYILYGDQQKVNYKKVVMKVTSGGLMEKHFDENLTFADQRYTVRLSCIDDYEFEIDDMGFRCNKDTKTEVAKQIEELGDEVETITDYRIIYKDCTIVFSYDRKDNTLDSISISDTDEFDRITGTNKDNNE